MNKRAADWDPISAEVLSDQISAYDAMRQRCPVAHSEPLGWSVFRHEDVKRVLMDPETFSNVVSERRSVPNGMDPPEHAAYRRAIEPFFSEETLQRFEPEARRLARELLAPVAVGFEFDLMQSFAVPFAVQCQCAFLGWSDELAAPVQRWTRDNREAILARDRAALAQMASEFGAFVDRLLDERRRTDSAPPDDLTTALVQTRVNGQPLSNEELTSIFRNWTVGEVGSVAASVGIVAGHVARSPELERSLRADPSLIPAAIEEMLRVEGPLVVNRRRVTRDVSLGEHQLAAGDRVTVMWVSANRDPDVFEDPGAIRPTRDQTENLVWGAGIHYCPGAPLARLELRVALETLLASSRNLSLGRAAPTRLPYPENGWASLPFVLEDSERQGEEQ